MTSAARPRFGRGLASHRVRSWLMVAFYAGILVTGIVGLYAPSQSAADTLPDQAAVVLWTALYGITAPVGALARLKRYYPVEVLALCLIIAGTALHGVFLLDQGTAGLQTGLRLMSGLFALAAIASALHELSMTEREGQLLLDPTLLKQLIEEQARRTAPERDAAADAVLNRAAADAEDAAAAEDDERVDDRRDS